MTRPSVMLFAAGYGTRMAPLTDTVPKPLIKVAGRALIDHALDQVRGAGLRRIVANTHYLPGMVERHLAGSEIKVIHEPELLDTGGGLRNALAALGPGPVVTLNTDAVWRGSNPISALLAAWRPDRMGALLALIDPVRAVGHSGQGDFSVGPGGRLQRGRDLVYTGVQIMQADVLEQIPETVFSLNRAWDLLAAEGRLYGIVHEGGWCDVGQPESIALAEAMLDV